MLPNVSEVETSLNDLNLTIRIPQPITFLLSNPSHPTVIFSSKPPEGQLKTPTVNDRNKVLSLSRPNGGAHANLGILFNWLSPREASRIRSGSQLTFPTIA
ncbi:hypothetical protein BDV38DRAFT_252547 [Aspergillus pseudotamarii]|uniref:Uncharacterized protein n=1 Tax=Aspergillus pseudotamarii TaxID=132259 RepID=A0A5N6SKU7_ASPPS|nr:uncharacterized protein BDV38DRAFT_252547 [Aspergillus pseudotamarii]KAE8135318.1 hypothetical protein BDV38DRAFT_252547 [Aspergillus pseudotamarii]